VVDHHPIDQQCLWRNGVHQFLGRYHLLDGEQTTVGGHQEQVVEVGIDAGVGGVAVFVSDVEVDEGGVEAQRRHGNKFLVAVCSLVRGLHGPQFAVPEVRHRTAQPGPDRQERKPLCGGLQPAAQHALVHLAGHD
jgi:hypothetical protein